MPLKEIQKSSITGVERSTPDGTVSCLKSLRCGIYHANNCWHFNIYEQDKFHAQLSWAWKKLYNLETCLCVSSQQRPTFILLLFSSFRLRKDLTGTMLYVFHVETGTMMTFDMNLAMER